MALKTKPRNTAVPFILDVYEADMPMGSARVVARCDTRNGQVWRCGKDGYPMSAIREALAGSLGYALSDVSGYRKSGV
jgi:hypothetical protein